MMLRRNALAVLLACLAFVVVPPLAGAARPHATQVIVSLRFPAFHGSLKSPDDGCLGGRRVSMFRQRGGKSKLLGRDRSNASGKWRVPVGKHLGPGRYFATVARRGECKGGRSKTLQIG